MGGLTFGERWQAAKIEVKSWIEPWSLRVSPRITPLQPHISDSRADDVPYWVEFPSDPNAQDPQAGVISVDKKYLAHLAILYPGAQLGLARAVGKAVLFAPWPAHVLRDQALNSSLSEAPSFDFAVRLGENAMRVMPALGLSDGTIRAPEAGVEAAGVLPIPQIARRTRVF